VAVPAGQRAGGGEQGDAGQQGGEREGVAAVGHRDGSCGAWAERAAAVGAAREPSQAGLTPG
jgi:hypothetical protein